MEKIFKIYDKDDAQAKLTPQGIFDKEGDRIGGFITRNFIPQDILSEILTRLENDTPHFDINKFPFGHERGPNLPNPFGKFDQYFTEAASFKNSFSQLFPKNFNYLEKIEEVLHQASGCEVTVPLNEQGEEYSLFTIRTLYTDNHYPPHADLNNFKFPGMQDLKELVSLDCEFSVLILLQKPQEGGALKLFGCENTTPFDPDSDSLEVDLNVGDLIIFEAGRIWHQVTTPAGDIPRMSMGAFAIYSKDLSKLLYWA